MRIIESIEEMTRVVKSAHKKAGTGFVPTMGYLHSGHLSLIKQSLKENSLTIVSIFVNPTQFGPNEDLSKYPRDLNRDILMLEQEKVDVLFLPKVEEMYPEGRATTVRVGGLTDHLCGHSRPGHFDGVALVVTKLFNIIQPTKAYFGLKDYQQYLVIKRFVKDLNIPVAIIGCPIVRDDDGLAMSSRNVYLSPAERVAALALSSSFKLVEHLLENGVRSVPQIIKAVNDFISDFECNKVDYIEIRDPEDLSHLNETDKPFQMFLAVLIGKTRLIDNKFFSIL